MISSTGLPAPIAHTTRKSFARIPEVVGVPDLIRIQHSSYRWFREEGLKELFEEISPIKDYTGNRLELYFLSHEFGEPKYSESECRERDLTYAAPLKVKTRLIIKETGEIKEQDLFMGDFPVMTPRGTFIINGAERVVVNQLIRSPGVYFTVEDDPATGHRLCLAKVIPDRGAWLEFETSSRGTISVKINRKHKIPVTTLLRAVGYGRDEDLLALFADVDTDPERSFIRATMERDPLVRSEEDALIEFYRKARPGEPPTVENARGLINALLFDPRRYRLGKGGRYKLNKRLGPNYPLTEQPRTLVAQVEGKWQEWLNRPLTDRALTTKDLVDIVRRVILVNNGLDTCDDIDHLGNRRVRAVGELLQSHLRMGLLRMERSIQEKMSLLGTASATPTTLVNNRAVIATVREFFGSSRLSQFMDQTNPLAELTHKRRLSALGPGGFSRDRAGFEVRDVHYSHYGRVCPIETPEGRNIGLITSLATYAQVNEFGFIETPYRKVVKELESISPDIVNKITREPVFDSEERLIIDAGEIITEEMASKLAELPSRTIKVKPFVSPEIEYFPADEEDKYIIAQANARLDENNQFMDRKVEARQGEKFLAESPDRIDFMDVSTSQIVSVSTSLIPFLEHDDANRALMGSNMQRQSVPLLCPESPVVGTGMEREIARDSGQVVFAPVDGEIISATARQVILHGDDGKDYISSLRKFARSNQGTCITQYPRVSKGERVKEGQVLVDGSATDRGELALGQNVTCAFLSWEGYTFEDAIVISQRLVQEDKFTSIHIEKYEIEARETKLGPEEITRDIPNIGENALRNLDEEGIVRIGAEVSSGDILAGKITPKGERVLTAEEKLLRAIFGEKARDVKDTSLRMPHGESGRVIEVKRFARFKYWCDRCRVEYHYVEPLEDEKCERCEGPLKKLPGDELDAGVLRMIRVSVAQKRKVSVGDKLAGRHGNKGVIARILPVEDMPYLADGRPVDVILSPLGVPSRMNIGQLLEIHLGWAAQNLGLKIVNPVFNGADEGAIEDALARAWLIERAMDGSLEPDGAVERRERAKAWLNQRGFDGEKIFDENRRCGEARRACLMIWLEDQGVTDVSTMGDEELEQTAQRLYREKKQAPPISGKMTLYDGRTGEAFDEPVTVGCMYIMKLIHLVEDKIHARSTGPYSLITQQPLGGKTQFGGQRFGEMEVWALEAYGAAYNLQEMLTIKSDDVVGRVKTYGAIVKGEEILSLGVSESFKMLIKELQSLGLAVEVLGKEEEQVLCLKESPDEIPRLGINLTGMEIEENE
ncbi:DNA-directed RNA polymerase subunit beta [Dehalococcoidia bacterium]|nr:DNA-directed RNA polymerase subunit beta [Dehalococcoidia bacterium]